MTTTEVGVEEEQEEERIQKLSTNNKKPGRVLNSNKIKNTKMSSSVAVVVFELKM